MSAIKGLAFDLDGVIADSATLHFAAWKRLADELGIPFTAEDNEALKGVDRINSLRTSCGWGSARCRTTKSSAWPRARTASTSMRSPR
jgi:beta-phosphoglucomutase-like phosphatase (HAD superfamily)